ncbi:GNAT family N-acetyltransferase [Pullulanibacillus sp. KACC 23026]|uniref:GNAT family N-acetyltransferase n=1 Tax=Pullulanibacillus sp. KACC 23026 TaxID=3028315 RepID=UPI0023AEF0A9|nr:GNAT family N-acetyltransferase [Pullulanibacillus sp. KACC 23026]WEG14365.1 GNAT family N-acetyltransferase [Pullulanibacillus sp. KACC 23026]
MQTQNLTVHQCTMADYETVKALLYETARWLKEKEMNQWQDITTGARDLKIKAGIEAGETFLFYKEGCLAGTIVLQEKPGEWDLDLWKEKLEDETSSLFIHRIATDRHFGGQGIGAAMLEWAAEYGRKHPTFKWLRLDCVGHNVRLNDFYKSCGFTYVGLSDNGFSLYEKPLI